MGETFGKDGNGTSRMNRFPALISSVLRDRKGSILLACAVLLQIELTYLDLPGWQCPIFHATSIPCPGCGLSRAIVALLQGDWRSALALHVFAPVFLLGVILLVTVPLLPERHRHKTICWLEGIERRTGVAYLCLVCLLLYWGVRLIAVPAQMMALIGSS
jgi:hypothetical protein